MIFSENLKFSDQQAITASAASTNIIDLGANGTAPGEDAPVKGDIGVGSKIPLLVQVTEDFATLTALTIAVEVDTGPGFSTPTVLAQQQIAVANLTAGTKFSIQAIPTGADQRYLRINYTVNGDDATAGKVTAGIVMGIENNG